MALVRPSELWLSFRHPFHSSPASPVSRLFQLFRPFPAVEIFCPRQPSLLCLQQLCRAGLFHRPFPLSPLPCLLSLLRAHAGPRSRPALQVKAGSSCLLLS